MRIRPRARKNAGYRHHREAITCFPMSKIESADTPPRGQQNLEEANQRAMPTEFETIFVRLRAILQKHAGTLSVTDNGRDRYCLEGRTGPATLAAWDGKMKKSIIPVAWVQIGKAYVSYHLMGMYGNNRLRDSMSKELRARMQGKTCFNFRKNDEALFEELEQLTARAFADFKKTGYVSAKDSA